MALVLNGVDQWIHAVWNRNQIPATVAGWARLDTLAEIAIAAFGDDTKVDAYNELETYNGNSRLVSFIAGDDFNVGDAVTTTGYYHFVAKMINSQLYLRVNGGTPTTLAWGANASYGVIMPDLYIGRNASSSRVYPWDGALEHIAVWDSILTDEEELALYNCTTAPGDIQSANLVLYMPLVDSLTPAVSDTTVTPVGLSSPTYETSGISYGNEPAVGITIPSYGSTFNPLLEVTGTPEILWTFSDGTTSTEASPTKDYGTAATRDNVLTVTPWSAVVGLNFGYGADDGGSTEITTHAAQDIGNITGLDYVADYLQYFCASRNTHLTALDFTDFTALETVECFATTNLASITLTGCTAIQRVCVESCSIPTLNLTGMTTIQDIRYAEQGVTATLVLPAAAPGLWHICVRDNAGLTMPMTLVYPSLRDVWIWGCGLSGALVVESGTLASLYCYDNALTSIDLADSILTGGCEFWGSGNGSLTSVSLPASPTFRLFDGRNCSLSNTNVNAILDGLAGTTVEDGTVQLTGTNNGAPSSSDSIDILTARGWTVETNSVAVTYAVADVTRDNAGNILGGCTVFLLRYAEGTLSVIGSTTSDATTGAFSIEAPDNVANYGLLSFIDGGTPRADATYPNIQPEAQ